MSSRVHVGDFELYVLLALAHLGQEAFGMRIRQTIADRTGRNVAVGAIYATLGRLEDKGLIRYQLTDPEPVRGGRARKVFALTPVGERALRDTSAMLTNMLHGLEPALKRGRTK
jgi:PadR family transcriptional regulator PadR